MNANMLQHYAAIRAGLADGTPVTVLHIGEQLSGIATGSASEPAAVIELAIGSKKTAAEFFRHDPPTPGELENAIVAVEDAIALARAEIPRGTRLFTTDESIRKVAVIAGAAGQAELVLSRDAMERTFDRLAAVSLGRASTREGLPAGPSFAATLLILREFMHHLQFAAITVKG